MPIRATFQESRWFLTVTESKLENLDFPLMEVADELVSDLEDTAPVGEYDGGTLKGIVTRVRGPYETPDGRGIGIGDATKIVPEDQSAPTGTIKEFLDDRNELGQNIPPDKSWAWWYLNKTQKAALQQARMQGRYGGMPGMAPYFWIQERGMESVHITAQRFMEQAIERLEARIDAIIERHLHAGR